MKKLLVLSLLFSSLSFCEQDKNENIISRDQLVEMLAVPSEFKERCFVQKQECPECESFERFVDCLLFKWEDLGQASADWTPFNTKELHFIMTGEIIENLANLSNEQASAELVGFNNFFMKKHEGPISEYEKQKIA